MSSNAYLVGDSLGAQSEHIRVFVQSERSIKVIVVANIEELETLRRHENGPW